MSLTYCKYFLFNLLAVLLPVLTICGHHHYHQHRLKDANVKLISIMKSYMDSTADPCHDFYRYACGNWANIHQDVTKYVDTIGSLDYIVNLRLKAIIKRRHFNTKSQLNEIYRKVRNYLSTCEEQPQFEATQYLRVLQPMDNVDWPEVDIPWLPPQSWNIWLTLGRLQAVGFNGFPLTLIMKHHNATTFQLELHKLENLGYTAYEQSVVDAWENSLDNKTRLLAENVQYFLNQLASLHKTYQEFGAEEMTIVQLQQKVDSIDFIGYFSQFLPTERVDDIQIMVTNLQYFSKLADLVANSSDHTLIHVVRLKYLGYLQKEMPKLHTPHSCMQHMRDLVPLAMYEREIYRHERNNTDMVIKRIFTTMQQKFKDIIQQHSPEFSDNEIDILHNKIMKMKLNIGNLPQVVGDQFYFDYFRSWLVIDNDFYWNHLSALQHYYSEKYKLMLMNSYSPHHTFFNWPYGSPAYQPSANLLIIPHAYLRFPLFHPDFHELFLYAELGNTLGHEMLHAFDTNGLTYDGDGNPTMSLISALAKTNEFLSNLECLHQQRPLSLNEKIADFSGFRLAYDSFFDQAEVPEFRGRNIMLSNKQLFFIKFAQFFCAIGPTHINYDDSHDTPFSRVPQVVSNHPEFEEIFKCNVTNKKTRIKKCNLW